MRHQWACPLLMSRVNVGPAMLRYVDSTISCLRAAGFTIEQTDYAWNTMDSHVYGFTMNRLNFPFEPDQFVEAAGTYTPQLSPGEYPHLTAMALEVMTGRYRPEPNFIFGLDPILDGLEGHR
jgi:hypothetical protein